jgi:hypothetical protein
LIVTTNYDDLVEQAFDAKGKPYHLLVYPTDWPDRAGSVLWWKPGAKEPEPHAPKTLPLSLKDVSIIYKMHGSINRPHESYDSFVITEEDYIDFLARMTGGAAVPARLMLDFQTRPFLFLGYGLADWNLRVMLRNLRTGVASVAEEAGEADAGTSPARAAPESDRRSWAIQLNPSPLEEKLWVSRNVNMYNMSIEDFIGRLRKRLDAERIPAPVASQAG